MSKTVDDADLKRIAEKIKVRYGYDFLNYALPSFGRRIHRLLELKRLTVDELVDKIDSQPQYIDELLRELTVNVTEMFRDPEFWKLLRDKLLPAITAKGDMAIWHAGCSSGEEVYSMAIVLTELGIYDRTHIVATDLDETLLQRARNGSYPVKSMELHAKNYAAAGGQGEISQYYTIQRDKVVFDKKLLANVTLEKHDLVTHIMPHTFDLILCRNVMIYFNQELQNNVLKKFHSCLAHHGLLALGAKESLAWYDASGKFAPEDRIAKVYRKIA